MAHVVRGCRPCCEHLLRCWKARPRSACLHHAIHKPRWGHRRGGHSHFCGLHAYGRAHRMNHKQHVIHKPTCCVRCMSPARAGMVKNGLSAEEAAARFWVFDKDGLITRRRAGVTEVGPEESVLRQPFGEDGCTLQAGGPCTAPQCCALGACAYHRIEGFNFSHRTTTSSHVDETAPRGLLVCVPPKDQAHACGLHTESKPLGTVAQAWLEVVVRWRCSDVCCVKAPTCIGQKPCFSGQAIRAAQSHDPA